MISTQVLLNSKDSVGLTRLEAYWLSTLWQAPDILDT